MTTSSLLYVRAFTLMALFSAITACGGGGDNQAATGATPNSPPKSSPSPQIGSPSYPMDSTLKAQAPNDGWLKVLAAQEQGVASASGKFSLKNSDSNDHCTDGKGNDGDKNKHCETTTSTTTTTMQHLVQESKSKRQPAFSHSTMEKPHPMPTEAFRFNLNLL